MTKVYEKRFTELETQITEIESTKQKKHSEYGNSYIEIDSNLLLNWEVKTKSLLLNACGENSQHFISFIEAEKPVSFSDDYQTLCRVRAVFLAAKEDYEGGYFNSAKNLIQAEVFDNELEQAAELLKSGYKSAAAVIAGTVLETALRGLCTEQKIPIGKLNKMNVDLAKAGVYNALTQKRIIALADIRNNAAHGNVDKFNEDDVKSMVEEIQRFISAKLS